MSNNGLQVLKLAKKAAKRKQIKRGVKEVIKAIRKNNKGYADSLQSINHLTIFIHCRPPLLISNVKFIDVPIAVYALLLEISHLLMLSHLCQCFVKITTFLTFMCLLKMNLVKQDLPSALLPACLFCLNP